MFAWLAFGCCLMNAFSLEQGEKPIKGASCPRGGDKVGQTNYLCSGSIPVLVIIAVGPEGLSLLPSLSTGGPPRRNPHTCKLGKSTVTAEPWPVTTDIAGQEVVLQTRGSGTSS
jgi:hypothetical protein